MATVIKRKNPVPSGPCAAYCLCRPQVKKVADTAAVDGVQKGTVNSVTGSGVSDAAATSVTGDKDIVDNTSTNGNNAIFTFSSAVVAPPQETFQSVYNDVRVQLQANKVTRVQRVRYTTQYTIYRPKLIISLSPPLFCVIVLPASHRCRK